MSESEKNHPQLGVSVIVPCRNEASYIDAFLDSVVNQDYPHDMEILVADGLSDDGSRDKLQDRARRQSQIRIIDNPEKIVSTGLNRAIQASRFDIIVRMDVHTEYATDYIDQCVRVLQDSGADNVGGPWRAAGKNYLQRAIAMAFQSPFSSGAAASHNVEFEGDVDSVYLGCWRKQSFSRFGMFDEELIRNQDDELNLRINRSGGRVFQSPTIKSQYFPRDSLLALFRQYMQYGYWKVRVIQKHKLPASIRHLIPGAFVASIVLLAVLTVFSTIALWLLISLLGVYLAALMAASTIIAIKQKSVAQVWILPLVLSMFHFGYGVGFLRGVIDFMVLKKGHAEGLAKLTRK